MKQNAPNRSPQKQRGQTTIFVVLGLGLVFLAVLGFAIDLGNMWFHRQAAQSASDAACTAAAMDMLYNVQVPGATAGGFPSPIASFDCTSGGTPTAAPCLYAGYNNYNGAGLVPNTESNTVQLTFPGVPDCTANPSDPLCSIPTCTFPLTSGEVCLPPGSYLANPLVQVSVTDRIHTAFFGLVSSSKTIDVPARSTCGLVLTTTPIPLLILDPKRSSTMILTGGSGLQIYGGPVDSIQVNSSSTGAFQKSGNNGQIDLSQGGPALSGSNMHVTITQTTPPSTSTGACQAPPAGPDLCLGTLPGSYGNHVPIPDPLASLIAPTTPTWITRTGPYTTAPAGTNGCPAPSGTCDEYGPGYYNGGINVTGAYAIFDPGIYYVAGGMKFGPNSCVRPSTVDGDKSGGTFFYFPDNGSINVTSDSGCNRVTGGGTIHNPATNFSTKTGAGSYPYGAACDSTGVGLLPSNIPTSISGSVLLAPCSHPKDLTMCAPNCTINGGTGFGDQQGDHPGQQRGILFMQNRDQVLSNTNMPSWQGGGAFLVSGTMYFHQCKTTGGVDSGGIISTCDPNNAYTDQLTIGGNASGTSYILGDIIIDQLKLNGGPSLYMDLSPASQFPTYKATLLQ